jgi:putative ABC transport system permease protein
MRWLRHVEPVWQDLRHGVRLFARNPALTAICIVSIAFGTGANVAMFSMVDALLLRPLPIARPSSIVTVGTKVLRGTWYKNVESYRNFLDVRDRARSFAGLTAYTYETLAVATHAGEPSRMRYAAFVTNDFFDVLGVVPQMGRGFVSEEDGKSGRGASVVVSDAFWRGSLAADPAVIGRKIFVAGRPFTIVGVTPASFTGLEPYITDSVFLPIGMLPHVAVGAARVLPDVLDARDARILTIKGRLRDGTSMEDAQSELTTISRDLERAYPDTNRNQPLVIETELEYKYETRPLDASLTIVLTLLAVAVLGVACANVAGLLTSRAPVRAREMSLRLAIGASRGRLIRQLLTECVLIAIGGGLAGLAVGRVGIALLRQIPLPTEVITLPAFDLDARNFLFSLAVAMATALLVGLGPSFATTRVDLAGSLKTSDRGNVAGRLNARSALVAIQVALSLVVLTLAVFAFQTFKRIMDRGPGFRTTNVAKVTVDAGQNGYRGADAAQFFTRLLEGARAIPGVTSASIASGMPLSIFRSAPIVREGERVLPGETPPEVWISSIDDDFFRTLDSPLLAGRFFDTKDDASAAPVAIVNDTLARHYWLGADPIGKRVRILEPGGRLVEVVGVVATTTLGFPGELPQNGIYVPYRQRPASQMVLMVSTAGDSAPVVRPLIDAVHHVDRDVPIYDAQTIETYYGQRVTGFGVVMLRMVGAMGLMGMVLTMVGLYGLVSYSVSRRTRELGIRIAIGATYARIMTMILRQGMAPALAGVVVGLALSSVTVRYMNRLVPFAHHVNAGTYYIAVPTLIVVALGAAFVPARRAALVNPTEALRCE